MADISQVKLPNGDTYNLVDETSGFSKIHILEVLSDNSDNNYLPTGSYTNLSTWINNGEFVIIKYNQVFFYYRGYYHTYEEYQFYSTSGQSVFIRGDDNIIIEWTWPLTSETDPVFSASPAAGISATDISNWNAKVSDDKTWNGVSLTKQSATAAANQMVPILLNTQATTANLLTISSTPTAYCIPKYDGYNYLYSTTPSANDNSTKVATTAYVDAAIPKVYSSTNTGGYLTMATLPIYDGTVV